MAMLIPYASGMVKMGGGGRTPYSVDDKHLDSLWLDGKPLTAEEKDSIRLPGPDAPPPDQGRAPRIMKMMLIMANTRELFRLLDHEKLAEEQNRKIAKLYNRYAAGTRAGYLSLKRLFSAVTLAGWRSSTLADQRPSVADMYEPQDDESCFKALQRASELQKFGLVTRTVEAVPFKNGESLFRTFAREQKVALSDITRRILTNIREKRQIKEDL